MTDTPDEHPEDPWLTVAEIAEELRLGPAAVRSWIRKGILPATRAGQRKFLVRRTDLERMLREQGAAGGAGEVNRRPAPRPTTRPIARGVAGGSPPPTTGGELDHEAISGALDEMKRADALWRARIEASAFAPPDPGFASRVRAIAEGAAVEAAALRRAAGVPALRWNPAPVTVRRLSYELRPGGNRPGPPVLWQRLDGCVERLVMAQAGTGFDAIADAFGDLSEVMHEIADELDDEADDLIEREAG